MLLQAMLGGAGGKDSPKYLQRTILRKTVLQAHDNKAHADQFIMAHILLVSFCALQLQFHLIVFALEKISCSIFLNPG